MAEPAYTSVVRQTQIGPAQLTVYLTPCVKVHVHDAVPIGHSSTLGRSDLQDELTNIGMRTATPRKTDGAGPRAQGWPAAASGKCGLLRAPANGLSQLSAGKACAP